MNAPRTDSDLSSVKLQMTSACFRNDYLFRAPFMPIFDGPGDKGTSHRALAG